MEQPSTPPEPSSQDAATQNARAGGINIQGGDVRAGRDLVAGDVNVAGDSITGQTVSVQRGYSAPEVQRLILIVGGLVFLTATFFFVIGAISAAALVAAINTPGRSCLECAEAMQRKLEALKALAPGQQFRVTFNEEEITSYFRFVLGPALNISDGKARFTNTPGQIAIGGKLDDLGGMPFLGQINVTTSDMPFKLESVWVKVLPTPEGSSIGYVPVTPLAQNLSARLNALLFGNVRFTEISQTMTEVGGRPRTLFVEGVSK